MAFFIGTFALTSLISANAVERLVPSVNANFTTNNNSGVLGLSEFEMQRIGVAAAVSFLGGIIQVGGKQILCMLLMHCICDSYDFCNTFFSLLWEKLTMGLARCSWLMKLMSFKNLLLLCWDVVIVCIHAPRVLQYEVKPHSSALI